MNNDSKTQTPRTQAELITRLRSLLHYDPETGIFTWKQRRGRMAPQNGTAGSINSNGYVFIKVDGRNISGHRIAWMIYYGTEPPAFVDHVNCIKHDNRIINLRAATKSQNHANTHLRKDNKSGHKGIHWVKKDRLWKVQLYMNSRMEYFGYFKSLDEAAKVACEKRKEIHGEFARLN